MEKKNLPKIEVETRPNGYSLKFDGMKQSGGHIYFTPEKLLRGFMLHIGLGMTGDLDTETMDDFIVAACNWKENEKCVKEIDRLATELKKAMRSRAYFAKLLCTERYRYNALIDDILKAQKDLKDYPDKDIKGKFERLLKGRKRNVELTLDGLGVMYDDTIDDENEVENDD